MNDLKLKYRLLLIAGLLTGTVLLSNQRIIAADNVLTLKQCVSMALKQNPLILSSMQQYRASLARVSQAKAFNQPALSFDSDLQPKVFHFKDSGESYFGFNQSIRFPGKRYINGKIARQEANELTTEIDLLKLDLVFQVKEAFYALLLSQEQLKHDQQNLELAQDFARKTEVKSDAGDVAQVEVLRAKVEASKAANEVKKATNEVRLAKARLNFLLARKKYAPLEIVGQLAQPTQKLNLKELQSNALSFRPEIKRINFSLLKESLKKKQSYLSYLPDLDLGVAKHKIVGEITTWDVTVSLPIPLFFWQRQTGEIAEAQANIKSLQEEAEHIKNSISLEVEESFTAAVSASNQIRLFENEIVVQAEKVYNMLLFSYQEGEISGIELIDARRTLIDAKKSYADALFNYDVALASLEKSIGQNLEEK